MAYLQEKKPSIDGNLERRQFSTISEEDIIRARRQQAHQYKTKEDALQSKSKLPASTITYMFLTAGFIDGVQALLSLVAIGVVLSPILSFFAGMTFWFWFAIHDVSFMDWKRLRALFGGGFMELIPVVDILPFWTGFVWYIVETTKISEVASKVPGGEVLKKMAGK